MNYLYISPEFPPNFQNFIINLSAQGVDVFGVGEADFYELPIEVRDSLRWYERVNLKDTEEVIRAARHIKDHCLEGGSFDLVESHNEYWLELEAALNSEFSIRGFNKDNICRIKRKSRMKQIFSGGGLKVAAGGLVESLEDALSLARRIGYPVILKPDTGVGGVGVHKISSEDELGTLWSGLNEKYILEEFIHGPIHTYDGLCDSDGNVIFENSLILSAGILDYIHGENIIFYTDRLIPESLRSLGRKIASLFGIRNKFFHFEFFYTPDGYIPIEINARPPGGVILDMMNWSSDTDLYRVYAEMMAGKKPAVPPEKSYYCGYISPISVANPPSLQEMNARYGDAVISVEENLPLYRAAMGHFRYIVRTRSVMELREIADVILRR